MGGTESLSIRDRILGVFAGFSALYCVAVSFALTLPVARKRSLIAAAICLVSFSFVRQKKTVAPAIAAFIAIKVSLVALVLLLQHS